MKIAGILLMRRSHPRARRVEPDALARPGAAHRRPRRKAGRRLPLLQRGGSEDRYAAADTMKINGNIFIRKGSVLYSVNCSPMFTVVEDTCGSHDTIGGCCSSALNRRRYGKPEDPSCRQNFLGQLARYGMGPRDLVANLNFFMYVPVGKDGAMDMGPSLSKPGDYVDLRAEMDVLAVISNARR